ncbi:S1 family peptidase [Planctomycetes bacterium K23_9]|uniref:Periplasmic serine endoprotease DegP n=1 Tax=Stieleria marina TaxID=1930275 RepID=A0A517NQD1_9BACT|nr:Periplasmic serine endoprotease DegP precursor [Planctomycetes bacterium K23_9]
MLTPKIDRKLLICVCGLAVLLSLPASVYADAENYQKALPSTVWIITADADDQTSSGTGVLVNAEKRLVITNAHVVGDSRNAVIFFPEMKGDLPTVKRKSYLDNILKLGKQGKVVAVDRKRDLALIQLPELPEGAQAIELAQSSTKPGTAVDLIGNPGGSDVLWVYSSGTVRAVYDKKFDSDHGEHDFKVVETQTAIRRGDSGGPVVNSDGELVAIAQSFSPTAGAVSFCVDISEIKALIDGTWKESPLPTKVVLDNAEIQYTLHSTGNYLIQREVAKDKTQSVFVTKKTEYYRLADVRRIWSLVSTSTKAPDTKLMMRLMRQSSATKIGSWAIEKNSAGEYLILFVAKLDATASDDALEATVEYVARIANAMEKELAPQKATKTAEETLASWLAD